MTRLRASRFGGQADGFSLVELLVALTICALIAGAVAGAVRPARDAFERTPAALEQQQRGRAALDALSTALKSAGRDVGATHDLGPLADLLPAVLLADPDSSGRRFLRLVTVTPAVFAAQGVLRLDQSGSGGPLALDASPCPDVKDVCGFTTGSTAAIVDGTGRFDLFVVASTNAGARRVSIATPFLHPYPAGSVVIEVDAYTFRLDAAADGSSALVRETAAGAVQPIIDGVSDLWFEADGALDSGALAPIEAPLLADGPWHEGGPDGLYDEDAFRVRRLIVGVRLHALDPAVRRHVADRTFQTAITLRNAP